MAKKISKEQEYKKALEAISRMGRGLREEMKDYANIGKNAVYTADMALRETCPTCKRKI